MNKVTVTLFTADGCPHCEAGRLFLRSQGVDYLERTVMTDATAMQDMLYLLGRAEVPALYAGYQAAIGFDVPRWLEVLAHARDIEREDPFRLPELFGADPLKLGSRAAGRPTFFVGKPSLPRPGLHTGALGCAGAACGTVLALSACGTRRFW